MQMQPSRERRYVSLKGIQMFAAGRLIGHGLVTAALHSGCHEIIDMDTARLATSCWDTHMEPNVPRTKASLSRAMMRLGVSMRLTCHNHANFTSGSINGCHKCHMILALLHFRAINQPTGLQKGYHL